MPSPHSSHPRLDMLVAVLILGLFCSVKICHSASCNHLDRDSLLSFSNNITFRSLRLDWSALVDCCSWEGVACDVTGRVSSLKLPARELSGTISPSLANLSQLSELDLGNNSLTGSFPDGFFRSLSRLRVIDLSYNKLLGKLPSSDMISESVELVDFSTNNIDGTIPPVFLEKARNLVSFNISSNSFHGEIPSYICIISPSIRVLDFSHNHFNGSIPQDVQNCSKLEILRAGFNLLSGTLPRDIYKLSALQELFFPGNKLNGSLSDEITSLENLRVLAMYDNEFSGVIPAGIGMLYNLDQLLLHVNGFKGTLPPSLTNCTRLTKLIIRVNLFEGNLSEFNFSRFSQLRTIDLGNNVFQGTFPKSLFACKSLTAIRLAANRLTGEIPPDIQTLESLSFLSISNNSLTNVTGAIRILSGCRALNTVIISKNFFNETFPGDNNGDSLLDSQGFLNVQILALGGCLLSGQIPQWLAKLTRLEVIDLSYNRLTGSIPGFLGSLPNLFRLDLSFNNLSGNFPVELTKIPRLVKQEAANQRDRIYLELPVFVTPKNVSNLQYNQLSSLPPAIDLGSNYLSGEIPVDIGRLKFIHKLDLSHNHFSGGIPNTISYLASLEMLDLSTNNFSGEIPSSLKNLHFLSSFNVAGNNLEGQIPTGGQFDTFPAENFAGNPGLCGTLVQRSCAKQSEPAATRDPSAKRQIYTEKIIFNIFVGVCFGVGFTISTFAMRNYEIEGSLLHEILKKLMRKSGHAF